MFASDKITEMFYSIDNFCLVYEPFLEKQLLSDGIKRRKRSSVMSLSEVLSVIVLFQQSNMRHFKGYYMKYVQVHLKDFFPKTVSYNRFVELMQEGFLALTLYLRTYCLGVCNGISFVDSTPIKVCKNKRINCNKVFEGIAQRGKSTIGWFYGFKLHLIVNDCGELLNFQLTKGNVDDRTPLKADCIIKGVFGKLYADKGYISKELTQELFQKGIHLVTGLRKNMKNQVMEMKDKILLRKRAIIETINDQLKNISQVEHSRHRSVANFLTNVVAALVAYTMQDKKPTIKFNQKDIFDLEIN